MTTLRIAVLSMVCALCMAAPPTFEPTSAYELRDIEGWPVHVNRAMLTSGDPIHAAALKELQTQLYRINRVVPKPALAELHKIGIWFEAKSTVTCACHHPSKKWLVKNGFNPEKAKCIELGNPANFVNWTRHTQPWMLMHELAHGYQQRALGYKHPELLAAYKNAVESKIYDSVLFIGGRKKRAYALNNQMEYFAELTEAYFGRNDFYPFVRAEIKQHDPQGYKLLRKVWEKGHARPDSKPKNKPAAERRAPEEESR